MAVGALLKTTLAPWECIKWTTFELKSKIPPKTKLKKKLVKLAGPTHACKSLTTFEYAHRKRKLWKSAKKSFVKSHDVNLFLAE